MGWEEEEEEFWAPELVVAVFVEIRGVEDYFSWAMFYFDILMAHPVRHWKNTPVAVKDIGLD